ncbi:hypothetical protein NSQ96_12125 [Caldifermentibacillus hisashii]
MTTRPNLVTILSRETPFFGDESKSRQSSPLFCVKLKSQCFH